MKTSMILALVAAVVTGGFACGDETSSAYDHLKEHKAFIGTWRYKGPLLEDWPGVGQKGEACVNQLSWKWILDRNAIEVNWLWEIEGVAKVTGKGLMGWNADKKEIVWGSVESNGGISLGAVVIEDSGKTSTLTSQIIDGEGTQFSFKGMIRKTGKDTMTWQALDRSGGTVDGKSPVYSYKRVNRTRGKKAAK